MWGDIGVVTSAPKWDGIPRACIRHREGEAMCGRKLRESEEFAFQDAERAILVYRNSTVIRVCAECAEKCDERGVGKKQTFAVPMALRGIKDNDK